MNIMANDELELDDEQLAQIAEEMVDLLDQDEEQQQEHDDDTDEQENHTLSDEDIDRLAKALLSRMTEEVEEELQEIEVHEPEFSGTTDSEWNEPALEDFTDESWEDMSAEDRKDVGNHFVVAKGGFPAENFGSLALPVVETNGDLNLNALQNAKARAGQVEDLSGDKLDRVESLISKLANENFEDADFTVENADGEEVEGETVFHTEQERNVDGEDDTVSVRLEPSAIQQVSKKKEQ